MTVEALDLRSIVSAAGANMTAFHDFCPAEAMDVLNCQRCRTLTGGLQRLLHCNAPQMCSIVNAAGEPRQPSRTLRATGRWTGPLPRGGRGWLALFSGLCSIVNAARAQPVFSLLRPGATCNAVRLW